MTDAKKENSKNLCKQLFCEIVVNGDIVNNCD